MYSTMYSLIFILIMLLVIVSAFFLTDGFETFLDFLIDKSYRHHYKNINAFTLYKDFCKIHNRTDYFNLIEMYIHAYFRYHSHPTLQNFSDFVNALQKETDKYFSAHPTEKNSYHIIESCTFRESLLNALDNKSITYLFSHKTLEWDAEEYLQYLYSVTKNDYSQKPLGTSAASELYHLLHIEKILLGEKSRLFEQEVEYESDSDISDQDAAQ